MKNLRILVALLALMFASVADAQIISGGPPANGVITTSRSGTISITDTFQLISALAYDPQRRGGWLQANGSGFEYVFLAGKANDCSAATKQASITLQPPTSTTQGGSISFNNGSSIELGSICITGTNPDTFAYGVQ